MGTTRRLAAMLVAVLGAATSTTPALAPHAHAAEPPDVVFTIERPALAWNNAQPEATVFSAPSFESAPNEGGAWVGFTVGSTQDGYRSVTLIAPAGEALHAGTYTGVGNEFGPADAARLGVDSECREAPSRGFTIHEIAWDGEALASLAVDFWCGVEPPVWYQLRYHSDYPVASLASAPGQAAFPRTLAGEAAEISVTVTGVGPGVVHPGATRVEGDAAREISILSDACAGAALSPGATCSLTLRFAPTDGPQVERTARLVVPLDSPAGYRSMELAAPITRPTSITIATDRNPAVIGNPVTFTAVITPEPPGRVDVRWLINGRAPAPSPIGPPVPFPGSTTYETNRAGEFTVAAEYLGTEGYAPSASNVITQVSYATSSIYWTVYPSFNQPPGVLDVFAIVNTTGFAFPPGGTLTITDETTGTVLGEAQTGGGRQLSVSLQRMNLPGLHLLRADYSGVEPWILPAEAPILVQGTPSTDPEPVVQLFAGGFAALERTGTPGTVTVEALDAHGALAPQYRGTLHVMSSDPDAELPSDHELTEDDAGTWRFPVTLHTAGEQTVTIRDTATDSLVAVGQVMVGPAFTPDDVLPVDVSVGASNVCAIAADGVVECWGTTADQMLGFHGTSATDSPGSVGEMGAPAVDVAVGLTHGCAALADGTAWCWGANDKGQAPRSEAFAWNAPQPVPGVVDAVAVSSGAGHSCALADDGTVTCWGSLMGGPAGPATPVAGLADVTAIASGSWHACALIEDGTVRCWGANWKGQLGDGSTDDSATLVTVAGIADAVAIAADGTATCAVLADGTVRCWGENTGGRLGDGTMTDSPTPVLVAGLDDAVAVTLATAHGCARLVDATIRCWGDNSVGQLGDSTTVSPAAPVTPPVDGAIAVDAGGQNTCALVADGLRCWGDGESGMLGSSTARTLSPVAPAGLQTGAIPAEHGACALVPDGRVRCWGPGWAGQLGDGTVRTGSPVPVAVIGIDDAVALASNGASACVVRADGTVWCWGFNPRGTLGAPGPASAIPIMVPGIDSAVDVQVGASHACAILADTSVTCWGDNVYGELGNGSTSYDVLPPGAVTGLTGVAQLALSDHVSCARLAAGGIECWGDNGSLQLGREQTGDQTLPAPVSGITTAIDVSSFGRTSCAALADGSIRCWGYAENWQLGNGSQAWHQVPVAVSGIDDAVDVVIGATHACAVSVDGTLRCWGVNSSGEVGDGTTLTRPTPVVVPGITATHVTAELSTCVQTTDGEVRCWGSGSRMGDGSWPYAATPVAVAWRTTPRLEVTLETPAVAGTLEVPVILTVVSGATDIAGWYVDESELSPGPGWWDPANPQPATFTLQAGDDERELHGFVRDVRGDWSPTALSVTRIDTTPPAAGATLPEVTSSIEVPIAVSGSDEGTGVSGWLVSDVPLSPTATDPRWVDEKPTTVTLTGSDGPRRVYVWSRDAAGNVSVPAAPRTILDTLPPYGGGAPVVTLRASTAASTVPIRVAWAAAADGQPGALHYELSMLGPGATAYAPVGLADDTLASTTLALTPGNYRFRVRPIDRAGNVGPWHVASTIRVKLIGERSSAVAYSGRFKAAALAGAAGGAVRYTGKAGRSASIKVTARGVAFVSTRGPARGKVQVWLDGRKVATVDLYASSKHPARIVWSRTWGATETHRIRIVVTGTKRSASTSKRVDIDAFAILR